MRVVAIKPGFYKNYRRKIGDEFDVPEGMNASWFVPVEMRPAPVPVRKEPTTMSEINSNSQSFMEDLRPKAPSRHKKED